MAAEASAERAESPSRAQAEEVRERQRTRAPTSAWVQIPSVTPILLNFGIKFEAAWGSA